MVKLKEYKKTYNYLATISKEPLSYKFTALLEDLLEKNPKKTLTAIIAGATLGVVSNYNPKIKEIYFTLQPLLTPEGIEYASFTIEELFERCVKNPLRNYALGFLEYVSNIG